MKISCPRCQAAIPADDINIQTGMAICRACNEVFAFGGLVAASPAALGPVEKPAGTAIDYARTGDGFGVVFPRRGGFGIGIFLMIFGGFWDLISGIMIATFLSQSVHAQAIGVFGMIMIAGFFIAGLAILISGLAIISMRTAILARERNVLIVRKVFGRDFITTVPAGDIRDVIRCERYKQNDMPVYGIAIVLANGKRPAAGINLSDQEVAWLRWLILDYRGPGSG